MREGLRRLAIVIRWASAAWVLGWVLFALFSGERIGDNIADRIVVVGFVLAPAIVGWAAAWVLDGFAKKPAAPN